MLSVLRLSHVLKKLQLGDIAKFLILQTTERVTSVTATTTAGRRGEGWSTFVEIQRFCHHNQSQQGSPEIAIISTGTTCGQEENNINTSSESDSSYSGSIVSSIYSSSSGSSSASLADTCEKTRSQYIEGVNSNSTKDKLCTNRQVVGNKIFIETAVENPSKLSSNTIMESTSPLASPSTESISNPIQNGSPETKASVTASTKSSSGAPCFNSSLADIVKFLELVGSLKHTKRTGWVLRDVENCESISGHMYRMSMMTFLLDGTEGLNRIKCMELALVHDLAESLVGDITPFCGISKEEKKLREINAMEDICKLIEPRGKRIMELFLEYENNETPESKFVKDLDRLDMILQAFEYEKRDNCVMKHQEFFDSTNGKFNHPFVLKLVNEIHSQRFSLAKQKGFTNGEQRQHDQLQQQQQQQQENGQHSDVGDQQNEFANNESSQVSEQQQHNGDDSDLSQKKVSSS